MSMRKTLTYKKRFVDTVKHTISAWLWWVNDHKFKFPLSILQMWLPFVKVNIILLICVHDALSITIIIAYAIFVLKQISERVEIPFTNFIQDVRVSRWLNLYLSISRACLHFKGIAWIQSFNDVCYFQKP